MAVTRNIFIVNPKFQYKFSFIICILVFLGSLIYPLTIYDLFDKFVILHPDASEQYAQHRTSLLILLGITQIAFLGIVFVSSIFISHKIAGPLYKLSHYLQSIREGGPIGDLYFRKGDNFHDIADQTTKTMQYLKKTHQEDFEYLEEVSDYIENIALVVPEDKKAVLQQIQAKLLEIRQRHLS